MTASKKDLDEATKKAHEYLFNAGYKHEEISAYTLTLKQSIDFVECLALTDGGELFDRDIPPLQPLIEGLIHRGNLCLLAGKPKSGKSWLAFQMAQAMDAGKPFLGRATTRAKTLYLALEDGDRRIHQRMHIRKWKPQNTQFVFGVQKFDGLAQGISQLKAASEGFDIVVIDTLIATLSGKTDESNNTAMAEILNCLADFAHISHKAILVVHHATKGMTDDHFDAIRGASSIRAAYDIGIVLQRKPNEHEALLRIESRDIEADDMTIKFDGATGWSYEGDADLIDNLRAGRGVAKALRAIGKESATVDEIADQMGITIQAAGEQLRKAEKLGIVQRVRDPNTTGKKAKDLWSLREGVARVKGL